MKTKAYAASTLVSSWLKVITEVCRIEFRYCRPIAVVEVAPS